MEINATLIVQAINFLVAYVLLRMLFFKPVVHAIKEEDNQRDGLLSGIEERMQLLRHKEEENGVFGAMSKLFCTTCANACGTFYFQI